MAKVDSIYGPKTHAAWAAKKFAGPQAHQAGPQAQQTTETDPETGLSPEGKEKLRRLRQLDTEFKETSKEIKIERDALRNNYGIETTLEMDRVTFGQPSKKIKKKDQEAVTTKTEQLSELVRLMYKIRQDYLDLKKQVGLKESTINESTYNRWQKLIKKRQNLLIKF